MAAETSCSRTRRYGIINEEDIERYIDSFNQADFDEDGKCNHKVKTTIRRVTLTASRPFDLPGQLNVEEFKEALRLELGKSIPIEQAMMAHQSFDKSGDGFLDMQEFMLALVRADCTDLSPHWDTH